MLPVNSDSFLSLIVPSLQKKVEIKSEDEEFVPKPVLKESNQSDDDVWEPTILAKKEKPDSSVNKRSRHSNNRRVIC